MKHEASYTDAPDRKYQPNAELVSIVIPAYNASETIDETVRSALAQSHENIEVVVVDDGSVDNTGQIVERLQNTDSRLRLIAQENKGVASARNAGIDSCRGVYIAFLDADDLWHPEKISKQLEVLVQSESEIVYSPCRVIDSESNVLWTPRFYNFSGNARLAILQTHLSGNGSSVLCTSDLVKRVGGFEERLHQHNAQGCEDFLFAAKAAAEGKLSCAPWFLVGFRKRDGSMSSNLYKMFKSRELALRIITDDSKQPIPNKVMRWSRAHSSAFFFAKALGDKEYRNSLYGLKHGFLSAPITFIVVLMSYLFQRTYRSMKPVKEKPPFMGLDISHGPTTTPSRIINRRLYYLRSIS